MANEKQNDAKSAMNEMNPEIASLEAFFGEDFQKEADFIGVKLNIDPDVVQKVLDTVDAFVEFAQGKEEYIVEEMDEDGLPVQAIDGEKLMAYVVEHTGLDFETIDQILDCEVDYFEQFGL